MSADAWAQQKHLTPRVSIEPSVGYGNENLVWSIAGVNAMDQPVNILSELKWRKIKAVTFQLRAETFVWKKLFVRGDLSSAYYLSGTVSDTDYAGDDRTDPTFHDVFNADKGGSISCVLATGYAIDLPGKNSIGAFIGYTRDTQSLYLLRTNGTVQGDLRSTYNTRWKGLLMGINGLIYIHKKLHMVAKGVYSQLGYAATADWNLIPDFRHPVSFEHSARGYKVSVQSGFRYKVNNRLDARLSVARDSWTTGIGTDTLYRSNGDVDVTRLNGVHRSSLTLWCGVALRW
jgi:hypothetical protein